MRVIVLPVCKIDAYPHVLLKYDFQSVPLLTPTTAETTKNSTHAQKFDLTPYYSTILRSGSIYTVCEIIKSSNILRQLFGITNENEENIENKVRK